MSDRESRLDGQVARLAAGIVALACAGMVAYLNWHAFFPPPKQEADEAKLNPKFVECRDARVADVDKMKADGVINQEQFVQFRERAISTCAGQFPPGG